MGRAALGRILLGNPFDSLTRTLLYLDPSDAWRLKSIKAQPAIIHVSDSRFRFRHSTPWLKLVQGVEGVTGVDDFYRRLSDEGLPEVDEESRKILKDRSTPMKLSLGRLNGRPNNTLRIMAGFTMSDELRDERSHIMQRLQEGATNSWNNNAKEAGIFVEVATIGYRAKDEMPSIQATRAIGDMLKPLFESEEVDVGPLAVIQNVSIDVS